MTRLYDPHCYTHYESLDTPSQTSNLQCFAIQQESYATCPTPAMH